MTRNAKISIVIGITVLGLTTSFSLSLIYRYLISEECYEVAKDEKYQWIVARNPRVSVNLKCGNIYIINSQSNIVDLLVRSYSKSKESEQVARANLGKVALIAGVQDGNSVRIATKRTASIDTTGTYILLQVPKGSFLDLNSGYGEVVIGAFPNERRQPVILSSVKASVHPHGVFCDISPPTTPSDPSPIATAIEVEADGFVQIKSCNAHLIKLEGYSVNFDGKLSEGCHRIRAIANVKINLSSHSQFYLDAKTYESEVFSDFPVQAPEERSASQLRGSVGNNSNTFITVRSKGGTINISQMK